MDRPTFLFSIDLEDVRTMFPGGDRYTERLPTNTERYLEFLSRHDARCTFFTVGDVARRYPALLRDIVAEGHEIACHSDQHVPLTRQTPDDFRRDLGRCLGDLARAGADAVVGYRAPVGSLVRETRWAYDALREHGIEYSSSVSAGRSLLYGWPEFGPDQPRDMGGIWEIPLSLMRLFTIKIPFASGVYFRVLPGLLVRTLVRQRFRRGEAVSSFLHPYDIDLDQERFMHPEIYDSRFLNRLMYVNRGRVFDRLEGILSLGASIVTYAHYVSTELASRPPAAATA